MMFTLSIVPPPRSCNHWGLNLVQDSIATGTVTSAEVAEKNPAKIKTFSLLASSHPYDVLLLLSAWAVWW